MDLFSAMLLVLSIIVVSTLIAYYVQKGTPTTKQENDKITENLIEEVATEEVVTEPEVVEKPKKKRKYYPKKPKTEK